MTDQALTIAEKFLKIGTGHNIPYDICREIFKKLTDEVISDLMKFKVQGWPGIGEIAVKASPPINRKIKGKTGEREANIPPKGNISLNLSKELKNELDKLASEYLEKVSPEPNEATGEETELSENDTDSLISLSPDLSDTNKTSGGAPNLQPTLPSSPGETQEKDGEWFAVINGEATEAKTASELLGLKSVTESTQVYNSAWEKHEWKPLGETKLSDMLKKQSKKKKGTPPIPPPVGAKTSKSSDSETPD